METETTQETIETLQAKAKEVADRKAAVAFDKLDHALSCYNNFVGNMRNRLAEVKEIDDFYDFRKEWQSSLAVLNLPAQLCQFHDYLAAAEQLNAQILHITQSAQPQVNAGDARKLLHPIDEASMQILADSAALYHRPFNKTYLRNCLVGESTKRAVYVHLLAVCDYPEIALMASNGEIKEERIKSLPLAITARECSLADGSDAAFHVGQYYKNLQQLYKDLHFTLPAPVVRNDEPLKGVTFEGRDQKLRYLIGQVKDDYSRIVLTAEPYEYTPQGGAPEPAVRVLASIPGVCKPVDIGNLDRNLANRIGTYYKGAQLALEVTDMGIFQTNDDARNNPYARLRVTIAEPAAPMERTQDLSEELEDMFNMDELK